MDDDDEQVFTLTDFKADVKFHPYPTILLVGKRNSGKSWTSVSLALEYPHVQRWCAWCGNKDTADFWAARLGSHATVYNTDDRGREALIRAIQYQEEKVRLYKTLQKPLPPKYCIGFIFDDCTSKRKFRQGELLEELFSNGRHYEAVIIISAQYIKQLPPILRTNTDYIVMLHNSKKTVRILFEEYVDNPDEFDMFFTLLKQVTGQKDAVTGKKLFTSLVYDNTKTSDRLDEVFRVFRRPPNLRMEDVFLGDPEWRAYNKKNFVDHHSENELRKYKKKQRIDRLKIHQQKQLEQRSQMQQFYGMNIPIEIDYDSDGGESDIAEPVAEADVISLKKRRGPTIQVILANATETTPAAESKAPSAPLDLREPLQDHAFSAFMQQSFPPRRDDRYSAQGPIWPSESKSEFPPNPTYMPNDPAYQPNPYPPGYPPSSSNQGSKPGWPFDPRNGF